MQPSKAPLGLLRDLFGGSRPLPRYLAGRHETHDSHRAARLGGVLACRTSPLEASTRWTLTPASIHPAVVGAGARLLVQTLDAGRASATGAASPLDEPRGTSFRSGCPSERRATPLLLLHHGTRAIAAGMGAAVGCQVLA